MGAKRVEITVPSHVHAGNPDLNGGMGRLYGTLGYALEEPRLYITAETGGTGVWGARREDVSKIYNMLSERYGCDLKFKVHEEIPPHVGLGSTTALYLSFAQAFDILCGNARTPIVELAKLTGRGSPSGLGLYTYMYGGMLYDGGIRPGSREPPPLVFRAEVPGWYRLVVLLPEQLQVKAARYKKLESEGLLDRPPKMDEAAADRASRMVLVGVLSNAADSRWMEAFTWSGRFNRYLGSYWSRWQGGIYCCSEVEEIVSELESLGLVGVSQSSWGPVVYGFVDERATNTRLVSARASRVLEKYGGGRVWITRVDNRGARVRVYG